MVAGRPVWIQSPARTTIVPSRARSGPLGVLRRGRGEGRALLLDDLPGRQVGGQARSARAASRQISAASSSRGRSMSRSALLIVTESRSGKANSHSMSAVDDAEDRRLPGRRRDAEMDVEDGAEFVRRRQARKEVLRDPWRDGEDHANRPAPSVLHASGRSRARRRASPRSGSPAGGRRSGPARLARRDRRAPDR